MEVNGQPHAPAALSSGKETPINNKDGPPSITLFQLISNMQHQYNERNVTHNVYWHTKWLSCIFTCLYKTIMVITCRDPEIQLNFPRYLKEIH